MSATPVAVGSFTKAGQALKAVHVQLEQLRQQQSVFDALAARLETLTDEPRRAAEIPIGRFASIAGQLIHLNDVLDENGVEMSAKEAREAALARKKGLDAQLLKPEQQAKELEQQVGQEAHIDKDLRVDELGGLVNGEGLPIMEVVEPAPERTRAIIEPEETGTVKELPTPIVKGKRRLDWRALADDLEKEEQAWLDKQSDAPTESTEDAATSSPAPSGSSTPVAVAEEDRPPSALKQRRSSSGLKKVTFDLPAEDSKASEEVIDDLTPEPSRATAASSNDTPMKAEIVERPIRDKVVERPIKAAVVERPLLAPSAPGRASEAVGQLERPIKADVTERPTLSELSDKARGKQKASDNGDAAQGSRPIFGAVVEKSATGKAAVPPDQALRDWMRLKTDEELAREAEEDDSDTDDSDDDDSDDSSNYHYDDDDEIDEAVDGMNQMMLLREAALKYHRERPGQVQAQTPEHDPDLENDELVDEEGNIRFVNIGNESRFRGGPNQTASLIIPALNASRESEPPPTDRDELDFFADAALSPEDRETVRARLAAIRDGIDPFEYEAQLRNKSTASTEPAVETVPAPSPVINEVKERAPASATSAGVAQTVVEAEEPAPAKKPSRFRARQAA